MLVCALPQLQNLFVLYSVVMENVYVISLDFLKSYTLTSASTIIVYGTVILLKFLLYFHDMIGSIETNL